MILDYDLCVIGGGINGAGIARDAAGRGLKVLLVEKGDLACATSSASTKLIHGGLRYLENFEFGLVRDSLREREVLWQLAPHIIRSAHFILPHDSRQRPFWMIGAGLFLYDHLAPRKRLAPSKRLDLTSHEFGKPLKDTYTKGFFYTDCRADDSRLVVLNALGAVEQGATVLTRTECTGLEAGNGKWRVELRDVYTGAESEISAGMVVNASGPWARDILERFDLLGPGVPGMYLVKGSHIIVRRRFGGQQAYILQQPDKRIVFVLPYEDDFTLIGTTEEKFTGDPVAPKINENEIQYLCAAFNRAFTENITKDDVLWTYSGVRPMLDDGSKSATKTTRDYLLHVHEGLTAPMLSVFGGKLTTYRVLSEKACNIIMKIKNRTAAPWTASLPLPGGEMPGADFGLFIRKKAAQYDWLPEPLLRRYARSYGTRMDRFLEGAKTTTDLGQHYGEHLYEAEVRYLVLQEWAREVEDILWRRTKLGLYAGDQTVQNLAAALPRFVEAKHDLITGD